MTSTRRIVALSGLSGSGKSTLIDRIQMHMDVTHLSASDLIKEQFGVEEGILKSSEELRKGDIDENQARFINAFNRAARQVVGPIIIDCHTVIDTLSGLRLVPKVTFEAIGVTDFVFLEVPPEELVRRRELDAKRSRPNRSALELARQQRRGIEAASDIANDLKIPMMIIGRAPEDELLGLLKMNE